MRIGVLPLWLFVTTTLFNVMLPELLTVPLYVSRAPGLTGLGGQVWVRAMLGVVSSVQVTDALFVTTMPVLVSLPLTLNVSADAQMFSGTR